MSQTNLSRYKTSHDSPGFLLWQVTSAWRKAIERALAPIGLTHVQYVLMAVLWYLGERDLDVTQVNLAKFSGCDVTMTSMVLRSLEKKGFVTRFQKPGNSRSKYAQINETGLVVLKEAMKAVESTDEAFFEPLKHGDDRKHWMMLTDRLRVASKA